MQVFVLGGTGFIGSAVVEALVRRGHTVLALARSADGMERLRRMGAEAVEGDLTSPDRWRPRLAGLDAAIHCAATFGDDMGEVDRIVVDALVEGLGADGNRGRIVYTGGCWLFGNRGDAPIDEQTPFDPLADFAWMVDHRARLQTEKRVEAVFVHPAMVYSRDGGVVERFIECAQAGLPIEVVHSPDVRWPLVHRDDLAELYCLALEHGRPNTDYHGVSEAAVSVGALAQAIARRFGRDAPISVKPLADAIAEMGGWAEGLAFDQQMVGTRAQRDLAWQPRFEDARALLSASD